MSHASLSLLQGTVDLPLALGIGANAAIFSMFEQTLLRPLPVPAAGDLINLSAPGPKPGGDNCNHAGSCDDVLSFEMFQDLERATADTMWMAAHRAVDMTLAAPGRPGTWAMGMFVSGSYFPSCGWRQRWVGSSTPGTPPFTAAPTSAS